MGKYVPGLAAKTAIVILRFPPEEPGEETKERPIRCEVVRGGNNLDLYRQENPDILQEIELTEEIQLLVDSLHLLCHCSGERGKAIKGMESLFLAVWTAGQNRRSSMGKHVKRDEPRNFNITADSVTPEAYAFFQWMQRFDTFDQEEARPDDVTTYNVFRALLQRLWSFGIIYAAKEQQTEAQQ
jgi:hypothetical protein